MHHALVVRVLERIGHLRSDLPGVIEWQRAFGGFAFYQLHDQGALFYAVDGRDVGMVERCQHVRFALEASHAARIARERVRQNLQRHITFQFGVAATVDLTHESDALRKRGGQRDIRLWEFRWAGAAAIGEPDNERRYIPVHGELNCIRCAGFGNESFGADGDDDVRPGGTGLGRQWRDERTGGYLRGQRDVRSAWRGGIDDDGDQVSHTTASVVTSNPANGGHPKTGQ
jgi:hypothetical protein